MSHVSNIQLYFNGILMWRKILTNINYWHIDILLSLWPAIHWNYYCDLNHLKYYSILLYSPPTISTTCPIDILLLFYHYYHSTLLWRYSDQWLLTYYSLLCVYSIPHCYSVRYWWWNWQCYWHGGDFSEKTWVIVFDVVFDCYSSILFSTTYSDWVRAYHYSIPEKRILYYWLFWYIHLLSDQWPIDNRYSILLLTIIQLKQIYSMEM